LSFSSFARALQFLTRIPVPRAAAFDADELSRSAAWFPIVGAIVGAVVILAVWTGAHASPWIAALLSVVVWVWITGGLHLDGLGDVADALAAAHRSPERFLEVLRDPHIGAFGVMAIAIQLIAKLVLVAELASAPPYVALLLLPAWARWGPLVICLVVPPLAAGSGERFAWRLNPAVVASEGLALAVVSLIFAPALLAAVVVVPVIALYWRWRLGGITGDCLGAGVELTETLLLLALVVAAH
jgi:adenosylcobinamide-GDP ribazoletransferase